MVPARSTPNSWLATGLSPTGWLSRPRCQRMFRHTGTSISRLTDIDESVAKVSALGGHVYRPPFDNSGVGRAAFVGGPFNERFSLFEPNA